MHSHFARYRWQILIIATQCIVTGMRVNVRRTYKLVDAYWLFLAEDSQGVYIYIPLGTVPSEGTTVSGGC